MGFSLSKEEREAACVMGASFAVSAIVQALLPGEFPIYLTIPGLKIPISVFGVDVGPEFPVVFPVNPAKIQVSCPGQNKVMNLVDIGPVNVIRPTQLETIEWSSWFPDKDWFPATNKFITFLNAKIMRMIIEYVMTSGAPCRLIISKMGINMPVTIESFDWDHHGGAYEDTYYTIKFRKWVDYGTAVTAMSLNTLTGKIAGILAKGILSSITGGGGSSGSVSNSSPDTKVTEPTVGAYVKVNGSLWETAEQSNKISDLKEYTGQVQLIEERNGKKFFLIYDMEGVKQGWVLKTDLTLI